jgi:ATP-dependent Clp protease ATP-binding subunit ClpA
MYERFTDRARKVMQLANQEAQRFNHEYIGTEHILLGLVKEGSGVAANVLKNLDVDLRKIRPRSRSSSSRGRTWSPSASCRRRRGRRR